MNKIIDVYKYVKNDFRLSLSKKIKWMVRVGYVHFIGVKKNTHLFQGIKTFACHFRLHVWPVRRPATSKSEVTYTAKRDGHGTH